MKTFFRFIFLCISVGLIFFGITNLYLNQQSMHETDDIIKMIESIKTENTIMISQESEYRIRDSFATDYGEDYYWGLDESIDIDITTREATTLNKEGTGNYYLQINFDEIKDLYPNMIAYLKVNGTSIEYPIVQGTDNSFYLKHSIDDTENRLGWPFLDYNNNYKTMSWNNIIYGHNIQNKTMFGELTKLLDNKKWFEDKANYEIYLVTENNTYVYKIFAVYNSPSNFNYFKTDFKNKKEFDNFIKVVSQKNKVKNLDFNSDTNFNQILTLSTCYNSGKERLVIHAYLDRSKPL